MMALSPAKSWAQDVTIGNGTSGVNYYPYNNIEKTSSSVMCYTSAELRGGTITSIAFRVCSASQLATNFVKVYMADTDITSLTTTLDVASISFTEVYSGNPTLGAATGWEPLALTTSFNHNKQKNLLVAVCRSSSRYNGGLTYYYHTTGTNYSIYCGGNDESNADITSSTNTYYAWNGWRPDTRFTFAPCTTHQGTYHAAVAPNCTTNGTVAHWQCDVCGKYFSDENCTSELASIVDPKLGHDLNAEKYCSRCEQTINQLDGTPFNLANYNNTIDVYSDHFVSGPVNQPYTGNLIFTGNGSQMINLKQMPANGKFALRDATITLNSPAIFSLATDNEVVIEGDVKITTNNGALYGTGTSPNLDVTGPGNLSISGGSSAAIESCFNNLNIDIEGDLKLAGDAFFSGTCNGEIKVNAKSITANCNGSRPFFYYAFKATLHAKGDILLESTSTTNDSNISYDKIWCFKGIESDEGTVLMRMGKGGGHESVGVKVGYAGIPDVSDGNSYVSAFTWKVVDKTTGTATYYGGDPRSFGGISGTSSYDVYLSLVKDSEGNTVFDMEKLYNSPINLYDGYFKNDQFNNICWEGHPVFTGTANGPRFLAFKETLSTANTPILRDLTFNTVSSCLQAPAGIDVAATIDGNVSMSCSDIAINVTNSCTITGSGSLTLRGSGMIYSCPDMNINITGDLVGSTTSSGAPLYSHSFDFTKLQANSITFRGKAGSATEHAIILPVPETTPAASDPSITYNVKVEKKNSNTVWSADYDIFRPLSVFTSLDGNVTVLDGNTFANELTPLALSDNSDLDLSAYTDPSSYFYVPSVSYERTLGTSNWGTIRMPFELRSNADVQYYAMTAVDLSEGTMTVAPVDVVYPGVPCLFKRLTSGNLNLSSGKTLVTNKYTDRFCCDYWHLRGTYAALNLDATTSSNHYYYINSDQFWHATGTVDVKPYRAYFTGEAPASSAKSLTIVTDDGETTSIEAVMDNEGNIHDASNGIYDMQGRKLNSLQKGINIVNGKKIVVK